jgi:ABC-2 type transport system permease protein
VTATTATPPDVSAAPPLRVTQARVVLSEWTKFRSLRSTVITLAVAVVITIGISLVFALVQGSHYAAMSPSDKASFNAASTSLNGDLFAQLAFGVLGVLVMTGEYGTGMIRASLTAVPRRLPVLWAKIAVFTAGTGIIALIANLASFSIGQAVLSGYHVQVSLTSPGAARILLGATLYVTAVGIMGIAIGALLRSTAGGISTLVGLLFVIPPVLELLPASWTTYFGKFLPADAGQASWVFHPGPGLTGRLSPWTGFAVLCLWMAILVVLAAIQLLRRDA